MLEHSGQKRIETGMLPCFCGAWTPADSCGVDMLVDDRFVVVGRVVIVCWVVEFVREYDGFERRGRLIWVEMALEVVFIMLDVEGGRRLWWKARNESVLGAVQSGWG